MIPTAGDESPLAAGPRAFSQASIIYRLVYGPVDAYQTLEAVADDNDRSNLSLSELWRRFEELVSANGIIQATLGILQQVSYRLESLPGDDRHLSACSHVVPGVFAKADFAGHLADRHLDRVAYFFDDFPSTVCIASRVCGYSRPCHRSRLLSFWQRFGSVLSGLSLLRMVNHRAFDFKGVTGVFDISGNSGH
jgi:hypothetical protein